MIPMLARQKCPELVKSGIQALVPKSPDLRSEANDRHCANLRTKVNATW